MKTYTPFRRSESVTRYKERDRQRETEADSSETDIHRRSNWSTTGETTVDKDYALTQLIQGVGSSHGNKGIIDCAGQRVHGEARSSGQHPVQLGAPNQPCARRSLLTLKMADELRLAVLELFQRLQHTQRHWACAHQLTKPARETSVSHNTSLSPDKFPYNCILKEAITKTSLNVHQRYMMQVLYNLERV